MTNIINYPALPALLVLVTIVGGCDSGHDKNGRAPQFGQQLNATGINADGDNISLASFPGKLVWVDYAAEWCSACGPQSATIRSLAGSYDDVAFVTVMTSEPAGFGHPATPDTAKRWARRTSLDPGNVVAADFTSLKLPQHTLFAPDGTALFRHTGSLSAAHIQATLRHHLGSDLNRAP